MTTMTSSLSGKTLFVTGGSRGIGLAIARRAAADGANVALIGKTTEPHPRLPGTLFTAAAEVQSAGGRALPQASSRLPRVRAPALAAAALMKSLRVSFAMDYLRNSIGGFPQEWTCRMSGKVQTLV